MSMEKAKEDLVAGENKDAVVKENSKEPMELQKDGDGTAEDVEVRQKKGSPLRELTLPFETKVKLDSIWEINGSPRWRNFFRKIKDAYMIRLTDVATTTKKIVDNFFQVYRHYDVLQMGDMRLVANPFSVGDAMIEADPMGIENIMKDLKISRFRRYHPAFRQRTGEEFPQRAGIGGIEQGIEVDVPLPEDDLRDYRALSERNRMELVGNDVLRQYIRLLDDEQIYTRSRELSEDRTFTVYYLPEVDSIAYRSIIESTPLMLKPLFDMKLALLRRFMTYMTFSQSTTYTDILKRIEAQQGRFNTQMDFLNTIGPERGVMAMHRLTAVHLNARNLRLSLSLDHETFSLGSLIECLVWVLMVPEACIDVGDRAAIKNYILKHWLLHLVSRGQHGNRRGRQPVVRQGLTRVLDEAQFDVPPGRQRHPSRILEAVDIIEGQADRAGWFPDAASRDEFVGAMRRFFGGWSRGTFPDPGEYSQVPHPVGDTVDDQTNGQNVLEPDPAGGRPADLRRHHINGERPYIPTTSKYRGSSDYDVPWDRFADFITIVKGFESREFKYLSTRLETALKNLLDWMTTRFYYHIQGYAIDYERIIRRLAFVPDSDMVGDEAARDLCLAGHPRYEVVMTPGDLSSAYLSIAFEKTTSTMPFQDICLDAWQRLDSFTEFGSNYNMVRRIVQDLHQIHPIYEKYYRGWEYVEWAWAHTRNKTALGDELMKVFDQYKQRIFGRVAIQLPARTLYTDKLEMIRVGWWENLLNLKLGIVGEYVVKPSFPFFTRIEPIDDPNAAVVLADDNRDVVPPFTFRNVFSPDDDNNVIRRGPEDLVRAIQTANLRPVNQANVVIGGMWHNVMIGGEQPEEYLTQLDSMMGELKPLTLHMEYKWTDIVEHYNIRQDERLPIIGIVGAEGGRDPIVEIGDADWTNRWFYQRRIKIYYPLTVILKVDQAIRS
jgi:hypothetical protein